MSWTTPRTWVTGELATASIMNIHIRDNFTDRYNNRAIMDTQFRLASVVSVALGTSVNDWNPTGFSTCNRLRVNPSSDALEITGFAAQPDGTFFIITNTNGGANRFRLKNEDASSSAVNRIGVVGGNLFFGPGTSAIVFYDASGSRWRALPFGGVP